MKRAMHFGMLSAAVVTLVGLTAVRAEGREVARADVPFAFVVENTTLPPGEYVVYSTEDADPGLLVIEGTSHHANVVFDTSPLKPVPMELDGKPHFTFADLAGKHFLDRIWVNVDEGYQLEPSSRERAKLEKAGTRSEIRMVESKPVTSMEGGHMMAKTKRKP